MEAIVVSGFIVSGILAMFGQEPKGRTKSVKPRVHTVQPDHHDNILPPGMRR